MGSMLRKGTPPKLGSPVIKAESAQQVEDCISRQDVVWTRYFTKPLSWKTLGWTKRHCNVTSLSGGRPRTPNSGYQERHHFFPTAETVSHCVLSAGCSSAISRPSLCPGGLQAGMLRTIHLEQSNDTTKLHNSSSCSFLLTLTSWCYTRCQWARDGTRGSAQYGVIPCMALSFLLPSYTRLGSSRQIPVLAGRRWPSCDSEQVVRRGHHLGQPGGEGKMKSSEFQNLNKSKLLTAKLCLSPEPPQHETASKSHSNIYQFSQGLNSLSWESTSLCPVPRIYES